MESNFLSNLLPRLFGYHLLQLGGPSICQWLNHCRIPHRIYINEEPQLHHNGSRLIAQYNELPFYPDSIDVVLLPHVLEFSPCPAEILEQVYQVLIPEGHLVILGFHPWSLWGMAHLLKDHKKIPWRGKFYSSFRVRHWLNQHGFQIEGHQTLFFRPPLASTKWLQRLFFMEATGQLLWPFFGGVYLIVAKKKVEAMTPIGRIQLAKRIHLRGQVVQPTARYSDES